MMNIILSKDIFDDIVTEMLAPITYDRLWSFKLSKDMLLNELNHES